MKVVWAGSSYCDNNYQQITLFLGLPMYVLQAIRNVQSVFQNTYFTFFFQMSKKHDFLRFLK